MKKVLIILISLISFLKAQTTKREVDLDTFDLVYKINGSQKFVISKNGIKFPTVDTLGRDSLNADTSQLIYCINSVNGGQFEFWNGTSWEGLVAKVVTIS